MLSKLGRLTHVHKLNISYIYICSIRYSQLFILLFYSFNPLVRVLVARIRAVCCALRATNRAPNIFRWPSYSVFVIITHAVVARVLYARYIWQSPSTNTRAHSHTHDARTHIDFAANPILFLFFVHSTKHSRIPTTN